MDLWEQVQKVRKLIDELKKEGDTVGGIILAQVKNVPIGLGSFTQWDERTFFYQEQIWDNAGFLFPLYLWGCLFYLLNFEHPSTLN